VLAAEFFGGGDSTNLADVSVSLKDAPTIDWLVVASVIPCPTPVAVVPGDQA
jgi:hypothetical protein